MEQATETIFRFIEESGWLAPVFFILFHMFRQLLFIPVLLVCLIGGYLFGIVHGTVYSLIGMTIVSMSFYYIVQLFPSILPKIRKIKAKWFGDEEHSFHISQLMIIRLMPFIHFHLTSLYLVESTKSLKEYTKLSFYSLIPAAFTFTAFGHIISELPVFVAGGLVVILGVMFYLIGRKDIMLKCNEWISARFSQH
ncbi:TVP38/TMEM64 family protein [Bacillus alkalicellulosilyticus]|uniref:TVP38/TMEM64 family protein n=1 Tax=Alkalihalobacterium alkalicellulosilyticum TaxID=1912214 RepID=UPI000998E0A1|nr:VTT domain-containing protein [Bacillus alkalicellulosilyticus]